MKAYVAVYTFFLVLSIKGHLNRSFPSCDLSMINKVLVVFRSPSRHTYGFGSGIEYTMPREELIAAYNAEKPSKVLSKLNFSLTGGSNEFQYLHFDGPNLTHIARAASRCVLLHGVYKILLVGFPGEVQTSDNNVIHDECNLTLIDLQILGTEATLKQSDIKALKLPFIPLLKNMVKLNSNNSIPVRFKLVIDANKTSILEGCKVYFCTQICSGIAAGHGISIGTKPRRPHSGVLKKFSLNFRSYKSNTALEPELSFLMSNLARIKPGSFVCDPFCGSCSLLLSAAYLGATCTIGFDSDPLALNVSQINRNFENAELSLPSLRVKSIESDFDISHFAYFDCIITDPPYNIKASVSGFSKSLGSSELICSLIGSLITFSEKALKIGGHLCFILPVRVTECHSDAAFIRERVQKLSIQLRIITCIKQNFTATFSRYIIVAQKSK